MERDAVRASAALGHYHAISRQRIEEMEEAAARIEPARIQCREGAITLAEFQAHVLHLCSCVNAAIVAADQLNFASSAKLSGW